MDGKVATKMIRRLITINGTAALLAGLAISPSQGQQRTTTPAAVALSTVAASYLPAGIPQPVLEIATTTTTKPATFISAMPTSIIGNGSGALGKGHPTSSRSGLMPPSGQLRPDHNHCDAFATLETAIDAAAQSKPNRVTAHRPNRTEYQMPSVIFFPSKLMPQRTAN